MSTSSINPFSTQQTGHKYTFQLQLKKISITPSLPFEIKIVWARGQQRIESQNLIKLVPPENDIILHQCFCNKSTVLYNHAKREFRKKQSKILVILYANGSPKQGGEYMLNLCEILDPLDIKKSQQKTYKVVTRHEKPHCQIQFKITAQYCQQMIKDQQRSYGSGINSVSSKTTNTMIPSSGGASIGSAITSSQQKNYAQKKNLFLYQAPSNDNQSVTSYTSYGTGIMRYGSNRKQTQSNSQQKKDDYNNITKHQIVDNFQKTLTTKYQISQDYDLKSKNSSYNRYTSSFDNKTSNLQIKTGNYQNKTNPYQNKAIVYQTKANTYQTKTNIYQTKGNVYQTKANIYQNKANVYQNKVINNFETKTINFDNKTQHFENVSSKQLADQQSKRSKLQAELTRLNIYMKQQSNKLNEYITQNAKLKDQILRMNSQLSNTNKIDYTNKIQENKVIYQQQLNKYKQQNNDLHNRTYQLNNQNRQLHRKSEEYQAQRDKFEEQSRNHIINRERAQAKFQTLNRNIEHIVSSKQSAINQLHSIKSQFQHTRQLNISLRQNLEKQRKRFQDFQQSKHYQLSTVEQSNKKRQQRLALLERQYSNLTIQVQQRQTQISKKHNIINNLQQNLNDVKKRLQHFQAINHNQSQQYNFLQSQNQGLHKQLMVLGQTLNRQKDQKQVQNEERNRYLQRFNTQLEQKITSVQYQASQYKNRYEQLFQGIQGAKKQIEDKRNQIYRLQTNIKSIKQYQNRFYQIDKQHNQKQRELTYLKQDNNKLVNKLNQLQQTMRLLSVQLQQQKRAKQQLQQQKKDKQLVQRQKKAKQLIQQQKRAKQSHPNVNVTQLLRESVQLQVQLQFKTSQLIRLKSIQQQHSQLFSRLSIMQKNNIELQKDIQTIEKDLKDKNKLYLIQVEKAKITNKQNKEQLKQIQNISLQLKTCKQIIFNGDRQVKDMQQHIIYVEGQNNNLINKIQTIQKQLHIAKNKVIDTTIFENKVSQLQRQIQQKVRNINLLTNNLSSSHKEISQLKYKIQHKQTQLQQTRASSQSSSRKLIQIQQQKGIYLNQLQKHQSQRASLELKNQTIMQELHLLKKQFEQQKGRSTSIVTMRSSEEQSKIRQMQNELEKKDKAISKLTKQKLQIQQQNINLHVQVMKRLGQIQRNKSYDMLTPQSEK